jgi:Protein of unknown function (DUF3551)
VTRTILVVAAAALISFSPRHANASEAPWCAVYSGDQAGAWSCQYRSFEECYPNALAKRGFCNPSPYYFGPPHAEHRQPQKRRARPQ